MARNEGRTIVFVNESGLAMIAGVTWWQFYFRIYDGSIRSPQVIDLLRRLLRQIRGKLLVIVDGLAAHRSRLVRDFIDVVGNRLCMVRLPAYAPELNPNTSGAISRGTR